MQISILFSVELLLQTLLVIYGHWFPFAKSIYDDIWLSFHILDNFAKTHLCLAAFLLMEQEFTFWSIIFIFVLFSF